MDSVRPPAEARDPLRMLRTTLRHVCPACGRGRLFRRAYHVFELCDACEVRFLRSSGASSGATWIAQIVGTAAGLATGAAAWGVWGVFGGIEYVMVAGACAGVLLTYRGCLAWWIWLLWATGMVFRDPDDLTRRRELRALTRAAGPARPRFHGVRDGASAHVSPPGRSGA